MRAKDSSSPALKIGVCGVVDCGPGWSLKEDWWPRLSDHDLWYAWAGRGKMHLSDGVDLDVRPGTCVWMRPGRRYVATQDEKHRLGVTFIHFTPSAITAQRYAQAPDFFPHVDRAFLDATLRRVVALATHSVGRPKHRIGPRSPEATPKQDRQHAEALLAWVLEDLLRSSKDIYPTAGGGKAMQHDEKMFAAVDYIRSREGVAISVGELADEAGYSADHFTRIFKSVMGCSPSQYAIQVRLDRAAVLLTESSLTVSAIAEALGYDSAFYLSRQFKIYRGVSPSVYRQGVKRKGFQASDADDSKFC